MGTHIRLGCRLLSELSASCHAVKQTRCNSHFSTIRKASSLCGANSSAITPSSSFLKLKVQSLSSNHRLFSSDASPHRVSDDVSSPNSFDSSNDSVRPFHPDAGAIPDKNTGLRKPAAKRETLFDKEFRQLDDLKDELDGRKSDVDIAGKRRKPGGRKVKPNLQPSFNFAAYVNDSPLLTELIRIGVDLTKWEKVSDRYI